MPIEIHYEIILLGIAALIAIGILLHHPSKTLGLPSLLIFMGVGLAFGNGEFNFVYDDLQLTSLIGSAALNIIVFVGGINTSTASIKLAFKEGSILSTLGVLLTITILTTLLYFLLGWTFINCLLFASIVSATDAAAVFTILKSKKLELKENTADILEFESATNDRAGFMMVLLVTQMALNSGEGISVLGIVQMVSIDIGVSLVMAPVIGFLCYTLLNKIHLEEYGLIPIFILACFILAAYGSQLLDGNVLLSSYIFGAIVGNNIHRGKETSKHFFNSLAWLAQSLMFIILGLQIFPQNLVPIFWISILPTFLLIFIARPVAIQLCYLFFPQASWQKRFFISAIGLKGATPVVFALIPAAAGVDEAIDMVNIVFFIVLASTLIHGTAIEPLANKLGLNLNKEPSEKPQS